MEEMKQTVMADIRHSIHVTLKDLRLRAWLISSLSPTGNTSAKIEAWGTGRAGGGDRLEPNKEVLLDPGRDS